MSTPLPPPDGPPLPPGPPGPPRTAMLSGGRDAASATAMPPVRARQMQILWLVLGVLVVAAIFRAFAHHENTYEKVAHDLTAAVQLNDMDAVQKLENAETAAEMTRARLGQAADTLSPLGRIKRVRETTSASDAPRIHEFDVILDKGTVHEKIQFDPNEKVFHFRYDVLPPK